MNTQRKPSALTCRYCKRLFPVRSPGLYSAAYARLHTHMWVEHRDAQDVLYGLVDHDKREREEQATEAKRQRRLQRESVQARRTPDSAEGMEDVA